MKKIMPYILFVFVPMGCVEEIQIQTELNANINIEDVLVVESTLTDELKTQEILLSRGSSFANDTIVLFEQNAEVVVRDSRGNTYDFLENQPGKYGSTTPFAVQTGVDYQLFINTSNGTSYQSETSFITGSSNIDDIYAERIISDNGIEGMAVFVDSSNPNGNLNEYRYIFEETYKIIAPNWTAFEFEIIRTEEETIVDPVTGDIIDVLYPDVFLIPREQEEQTCYNTVLSNEIILSDGNSMSSSSTERNMVRFISREDPILSHRYSILVKQFLQSVEAAKFYRTLLQFSQSENLFSQIQPGFLEGNITTVGTGESPVIGFFNVASVTETRLFFDYEDFFPGEPLPPYFNELNCSEVFSPPLENPLRDGPWNMDDCGFPRKLTDYVEAEDAEFFLSNSDPPPLCEGPYLVTQRACGDCTVLGTNVIPEFWEE